MSFLLYIVARQPMIKMFILPFLSLLASNVGDGHVVRAFCATSDDVIVVAAVAN